MPYKPTQDGFTMVELVAAIVVMAVIAIYAAPRMMGSSDFAAKTTADRVLAALQYAQMLAQRQGVATEVVITTAPPNHLAVQYQAGPALVEFTTQNYDGSATTAANRYDVDLSPDVTIIPGATIIYGANGTLTAGAATYTITHGISDNFKIKVEPTGFAHFE